ncbi:MAG: hypothetical protein Q9216_006988, partial [Gyalolechia sp. 2 TL-2023]
RPGSYTELYCCGLIAGSAEARAGCCGTKFNFEDAGGTGGFFPPFGNDTGLEASSASTRTTVSSVVVMVTNTRASAPAATVTNTPAPAPTTLSPSPASSTQREVTIGVGVGVPLAVAALSVLGFLLLREYRRRKHAEKLASDVAGGGKRPPDDSPGREAGVANAGGNTTEPDDRPWFPELGSKSVQLRELQSNEIYENELRSCEQITEDFAQKVKEKPGLDGIFELGDWLRRSLIVIHDHDFRPESLSLPLTKMTRLRNSNNVGLTNQSSATVTPALDQGFKRISLHPGFTQTQRPEDPTTSGFQRRKKYAKSTLSDAEVESYTHPFLQFISENPTVFHAVKKIIETLKDNAFTELSAREPWSNQIKRGGKYFVERNGSSVIAFAVGNNYKPGNGAAVIASHVDALTTKVKPFPTKPTTAGYVQLGIAPYAGALNKTWWDRDLGIGGKVLAKDPETGRIEQRLMKLDWPIARIPTLAPHFGAPAYDPNPNPETQMVPIIGLDQSDGEVVPTQQQQSSLLGGAGAFASTQPPRLVNAVAKELRIQPSDIVNWELEVFDTQPAQLGGLDKEFIFAPRIDDKLCAYAAIEALIASTTESDSSSLPLDQPPTVNDNDDDGIIKIVGCFDDEEIGSLLRQGARSNFLPDTIERTVAALAASGSSSSSASDLVSQTYANGFLISADVSHAVNPNYLDVYLEHHAPRLNVGVAVQADPNGHTTTNSVSTAFLQCVADKCDSRLQVFQIRNDSRSGGTVGPMLSAAMGMRAVDAGLPQLSMHSIRATCGDRDPGLGVRLFKGFFDHFEEVDGEFR